MYTFFIWFFGVSLAGAFSMMIGSVFSGTFQRDRERRGRLIGMFTFALIMYIIVLVYGYRHGLLKNFPGLPKQARSAVTLDIDRA